jgi:membrane peptidoglycan carboxypeptidase
MDPEFKNEPRPVRRAVARFVSRCVVYGTASAVLLAPAGAALVMGAEAGDAAVDALLPDEELVRPQLPQRSQVLAADGSVLATFFRQDRVVVDLGDMAPVLRRAVLAVEDARFYEHGALDPVGAARALVANLRAGRIVQGGSTITQQYAKRLRVLAADDPEEARAATASTIERKVRELALAVDVEREMTKDQILAGYLNIAYFGNGAHGVEIAAERYFGTSADELTLPQAALLAGLLQAPHRYDPVRRPEAAERRRAVVLARMADAGFISEAKAERARRSPLGLDVHPARNGCKDSTAPFYCSYMLAELRRTPSLGADPAERMERLLTGGLRVHTTLLPRVQRGAERAIKRHIGHKHPIGAAIVITEPGSGAVRAIALNRRWGTGKGATKLNYALDQAQGGSSGFQAGSTFKPFVLAAAMRKGIKRSLELPAPDETTVKGFKNCRTRKTYPPYTLGNYQGNDYGRISMWEATAMSVNTYFVKLQRRTGQCAPARIAENMGLRRADGGRLTRVPAFVLGVDEVSPLRMAEAYATLAAGGVHCDSYAIARLADADGERLEPPSAVCGRVLPKRVAHRVNSMLRTVIDGENPRRTGARMSLGRPAAGKTGTTNRATAIWFAGFTRQYAAAVWAGYPGRSKPMRGVTVDGVRYRQLYGGALPGPIWRDAMRAAHRSLPERALR